MHRLGRTARAGSKGHGVLVLGTFESFFLRNKTLQTFNITPYASSTPASRSAVAELAYHALSLVTDEAKVQAYQAWLGYYNGNLKALRWSQADLVNAANAYARNTLRYHTDVGEGWMPPPLQAKTVGKMGLKGVKGLIVTKGDAGMSRNGPAQGRAGPGAGGIVRGAGPAGARGGDRGAINARPTGKITSNPVRNAASTRDSGSDRQSAAGASGQRPSRGGYSDSGAAARVLPPAQTTVSGTPGPGETRGQKRAKGGPQGGRGRGAGSRGGMPARSGGDAAASTPKAVPKAHADDEFGGW